VRSIVSRAATIAVVVLVAAFALVGCDQLVPRASEAPRSRAADGSSRLSIAGAWKRHAHGVTVEDRGTVARILPDDRAGSRHQRLLVRIDGGPTVLVAHNIDLAPRADVRTGDRIALRGEYIWNPKGGIVHWTHRDPDGHHRDGWIEAEGRRVQ